MNINSPLTNVDTFDIMIMLKKKNLLCQVKLEVRRVPRGQDSGRIEPRSLERPAWTGNKKKTVLPSPIFFHKLKEVGAICKILTEININHNTYFQIFHNINTYILSNKIAL